MAAISEAYGEYVIKHARSHNKYGQMFAHQQALFCSKNNHIYTLKFNTLASRNESSDEN